MSKRRSPRNAARPDIVRRIPKASDQRFTVLPNHLIQNREMTIECRGALADLLSRSDRFTVSSSGLKTWWKVGQHVCRRLISEAMQFGYMARHREIDERGRFLRYAYYIDTDPAALAEFMKTLTEQGARPYVDFPRVDDPHVDDQPPTKIQSATKQQTFTKKESPPPKAPNPEQEPASCVGGGI